MGASKLRTLLNSFYLVSIDLVILTLVYLFCVEHLKDKTKKDNTLENQTEKVLAYVDASKGFAVELSTLKKLEMERRKNQLYDFSELLKSVRDKNHWTKDKGAQFEKGIRKVITAKSRKRKYEFSAEDHRGEDLSTSSRPSFPPKDSTKDYHSWSFRVNLH